MNHPQYYPVLPWMATLCVNPLETVKNLMAVFVAVCSHDGFEKTLRIADVKLLVQEVFTTFATLNRISMLPVDSIILHLRKTKCVCQKWLTPMPFWRTARPPHLVTPFGPGIQQTWSNPCGGRKHTIQNTVIICIYIYMSYLFWLMMIEAGSKSESSCQPWERSVFQMIGENDWNHHHGQVKQTGVTFGSSILTKINMI